MKKSKKEPTHDSQKKKINFLHVGYLVALLSILIVIGYIIINSTVTDKNNAENDKEIIKKADSDIEITYEHQQPVNKDVLKSEIVKSEIKSIEKIDTITMGSTIDNAITALGISKDSLTTLKENEIHIPDAKGYSFNTKYRNKDVTVHLYTKMDSNNLIELRIIYNDIDTVVKANEFLNKIHKGIDVNATHLGHIEYQENLLKTLKKNEATSEDIKKAQAVVDDIKENGATHSLIVVEQLNNNKEQNVEFQVQVLGNKVLRFYERHNEFTETLKDNMNSVLEKTKEKDDK